MKMKRLVSMLLAGVMTLSLAACGSGGAQNQAPAADTGAETQTAVTEAEPAAEPETTEAVENTDAGEPITLNM